MLCVHGADGGVGYRPRSKEERLQRKEKREEGGTKDLQMKERRDD